MHATAVGREDADAPVPDLVAEAFDDDRPVGRDDARRCLLLAEERDEVPRGQRVEAVVLLDPCDRSVVGESRQLTGGPADLLPELGGPPHTLALPERSDARRARRRRHDDPVARYLHDPPRRCAEDERLALAGLVHHLLVQLPDAAAAVDEKDAEEPAVRDRPGIGDGEPPSAGPTADRAGRAIPDDARSKLREVVGGIAAREHVEDVLELRARQLGERVRAPHELVHLVDGELLVRADRDDLLREHVERIPRDARLLDVAVAHRTCHHRRLEEVGPVLGEDPSLRDRIEVVSCPADPLESTRDGLRALHLDHEVDGAHVDAELQRRRGDEARDPARLQELLDDEPLLARERPVVRPRDVLARELVDPEREALGESPVVDEDDGRPVLTDELEDRRVDRRPDGAARPLDAHFRRNVGIRGRRIRRRRP